MKQAIAQALRQFCTNVRNSPKTSATGAAGIAGAITAVVADWHVLTNALWWTGLFVAVGLLFTPDHKPDQPDRKPDQDPGTKT